MIPKLGKKIPKKEKCRSIQNTWKLFNTIIANWIQQQNEVQGMHGWFIICKSTNEVHYINRIWSKTCDHLNKWNKTLKNIFSLYDERSDMKIITFMEETGKVMKNEKTTCVHGLEESILFKCLYYLNKSTDWMQYLSKYQWHSFKN